MSCTNPIYAVCQGLNTETGKKVLQIVREPHVPFAELSALFGDALIALPCGKCDSCYETRTKTWAARCALEASLYDRNCFITLTYRDSCLPKFGLCKKDVQKFIKRLRKANGSTRIRYYCCGEYGTNTKRPHYHLIIFNWFPDDVKFFKRSDFGEGNLYTSKELQRLWPFGFSMVGDCSFESCAYVARYCMKKFHYENCYKPFSLMSLKPGIGYQFLEDNLEVIYETDKVYGKFGKSTWTTPFRYYDKVLENIDADRLAAIKSQRISSSKLTVASEMLNLGLEGIEDLYAYKGALKKLKMSRLKRKEL